MDRNGFEIENCVLSGIPPTIYYIEDFITKDEEELLIKRVYAAPKPKWTILSNRRLQNWGGLPHPKGMVVEPIPDWLGKYSKKIAELGVFDNKVPNHVLVNEYLPGQGIMPHEDGPLFYPIIATINLGSHTVLNYYHKLNEDHLCKSEEIKNNSENRHLASVLLEQRSLLIVKNDMYHHYLHGIEEKLDDEITKDIINVKNCKNNYSSILTRDRRISLTYRFVPKIIIANLPFLKKY